MQLKCLGHHALTFSYNTQVMAVVDLPYLPVRQAAEEHLCTVHAHVLSCVNEEQHLFVASVIEGNRAVWQSINDLRTPT